MSLQLISRLRAAGVRKRDFRRALALQRHGLLPAAEGLYRAVLRRAPGHVQALFNLGLVLVRQGRFDDAVVQFDKALAQKPDFAAAHNAIGIALRMGGRAQEAIRHYAAALAIKPDYAEVENNFGLALQALGRDAEAVDRYRRALALAPDYFEAESNLAAALRALHRFTEAAEHCRNAVALRPSSAEAHNNLAAALQLLGRHDEALAEFDRALALAPQLASAWHGRGTVLRTLGRLGEAQGAIEQAIAIQPRRAEFYRSLAETKRFQRGDPHCALIEGLARDIAALPEDERIHLHFALGKVYADLAENERAFDHLLHEECMKRAKAAYDEPATIAYPRSASRRCSAPRCAWAIVGLVADGGRWSGCLVPVSMALPSTVEGWACASADLAENERAFDHLLHGNALKRAKAAYDEPATIAYLERIEALFSAAVMRERAGAGDPSPVPVFIIGMPRSGTTLVEQMLASHPQIHGAGELGDFEAAVAALGGGPEGVPADIGDTELRRIGARYLAAVTPHAPEARRITDKMPANFRFAGLIHLALPNARLVHIRRDPVDTCLSCFSLLFGGEHPYAYDLAELGRFYRAYQKLMEHWRRVLPSGVMLEVGYEELVREFAPQARAIVAHCGLEWDQACLEFHKTERPVHTASAVQVRQPLYQSAVGRWRPRDGLLRPLLEALAGG